MPFFFLVYVAIAAKCRQSASKRNVYLEIAIIVLLGFLVFGCERNGDTKQTPKHQYFAQAAKIKF